MYNSNQPLLRLTISENNKRLKKLNNKYSSWQWRFGTTPEFDISFKTRFKWGGVELKLKLTAAEIEEAALYSDVMYSNLINSISNSLVGLTFREEIIVEKLREVFKEHQFPDNTNDRQMSEEFISWIKEELEKNIF